MIDECSDKTLKTIKEIGEELIKDSINYKYPFRWSWLHDLIENYVRKPGKSLIHLEDLPDKVCVSFSEEGKKKIEKRKKVL